MYTNLRRAGRVALGAATSWAVKRGLNKIANRATGPRFVTWRSQRRILNRIGRIERGMYKEMKTLDKVPYNTTISTTGTIQPLCEMTQGDTSITREGLIIQPRHLQYKLRYNIHASASSSYIRVIIFKDREMHGTYPTIAELLEADSIVAWPEHDTRPRFKIYRDIMIPMCTTASATGAGWITGIIKFGKKAKIHYSGTTAAEASDGKNHMFVYAVSSEATNTPYMGMYTRLRFVDG